MKSNIIGIGMLSLLLAFPFTAPAESFPPRQTEPAQQMQADRAFSQHEHDQMLAPIALYPDALLSQILMAATYPLDVIEAARWSRANPGLRGDQAVNAAEGYDWDPSVTSLTAFPQVLAMMDEKRDWTERLGDAFLAQQAQVMDTIQYMRHKADEAGNLRSGDEVRVENRGQTIIIEQAAPDVVYVPYYNPTVVYGPWWWDAYPPVYWAPWPGYGYYSYGYPGYGTAVSWGIGFMVGSGFFFGGCDWPHRHVRVVNVDNHYYNHYYGRRYQDRDRALDRNRSHDTAYGVPGYWRHDPQQRRGYPYRSRTLQQQYGRSGAPQGAWQSPRMDGRASFDDTFRRAPLAAANVRSGLRPEQRAEVQQPRVSNPTTRPFMADPTAGRVMPRQARLPGRGVAALPSVPERRIQAAAGMRDRDGMDARRDGRTLQRVEPGVGERRRSEPVTTAAAGRDRTAAERASGRNIPNARSGTFNPETAARGRRLLLQ